ncbi:hypothetical protein ES703_97487 [subsurface metagenome]
MESYQVAQIGAPRPIGQRGALAAGTYTDIVDIVAPSSARAGESVPVTIKIKNTFTASVHVYAVGVWDSEERFIDWLDYWISPGSTHSFSGSFVMPDRDVTIHAYSYYEAADGYLYFDDEAETVVTLAEVLEGTISRKELEYDESRVNIPAYDIPQGQRGLVHIWGRNDTGSYQTLGIGWVVTDPDGLEVERHEDDWAAGWVGAGQDREFIGGRFNLDKAGTYRIAIALYMNSADPVEVDSYYGTLCTVIAAVPEPEFYNFEVIEYIKV